MGRLHRLPYHPHQIVSQGVQVCFVSQLGRERFQCLSSIILPTVEAPVYEALYAPPQGSKQRGDQERGSHDREGGLLAGQRDEHSLQYNDAYEVEYNQCGGERTVDEGAVMTTSM
jgi:hypothetical protein